MFEATRCRNLTPTIPLLGMASRPDLASEGRVEYVSTDVVYEGDAGKPSRPGTRAHPRGVTETRSWLKARYCFMFMPPVSLPQNCFGIPLHIRKQFCGSDTGGMNM